MEAADRKKAADAYRLFEGHSSQTNNLISSLRLDLEAIILEILASIELSKAIRGDLLYSE